MKTRLRTTSNFNLILILLTSCFLANSVRSNAQALATNRVETVVARGPHDRTVQTLRYVTGPDGQQRPIVGRYVEVKNGMHYQLPSGEWAESQSIIEPQLGGAKAVRGQYKVFFANNLNTDRAIQITTPEGRRLDINLLGLAWFDPESDLRSWIGTLQDCVGRICHTNSVVYGRALLRIDAAIRYTYAPGEFEADVILHENPTLPAGFNPETSRLEVISCFVDPDDPAGPNSTHTELDQTPGLAYTLLGFGQMQMIPTTIAT